MLAIQQLIKVSSRHLKFCWSYDNKHWYYGELQWVGQQAYPVRSLPAHTGTTFAHSLLQCR